MADADRIEGRNPVREALRAGRPLRRILVAEGIDPKRSVDEIVAEAKAAGIRVERAPRHVLDRMATGRSHQGVIAEAEPYRYRSWEEAVGAAAERGEKALLLAIDGVTDPGNLGSLIRTAGAAGVHAVIVPKRRAAPVTATVEKASAGAVEHVAVDQVTNLERTLEQCKKLGIWVVGLEGKAEASVWDCDLFDEPVVVVVGAEGRGLSRLISERADALVRIPMAGRVESLNVSVAGAVALFEVARRRARADR